MGVKQHGSVCFSRATALQCESQYVTRDTWFKQEQARPRPPLPTLLPPSLAHGMGLLRVTQDGTALNPNP